jgi:D-xylose transport system substrate-binding protein
VRGTQTMTIYKPIQPLAFSAVDAAMKLARKEPLNTTETINNGKKDVPAILHEPMAVDKSNVDSTIIKDGYHSREDIYGN